MLGSDRAMARAAIDDAIARRSPLNVETRVRTGDGMVRWLSSRAVPVLGEDGAITEWFGMATDITARRQTEQQLARGARCC